QAVINNSTHDGGHEIGLRRARLVAADTLDPLALDISGRGIVKVLPIGQMLGSERADELVLFRIFLAQRSPFIINNLDLGSFEKRVVFGAYFTNARFEVAQIELSGAEGSNLFQATIHQQKRAADRGHRNQYAEE